MSDKRPIRNWPGYVIDREGNVFSSRNSRDGSLKPKLTRDDGTVLLSGPNGKRSYSVKQLVLKVWGLNE